MTEMETISLVNQCQALLESVNAQGLPPAENVRYSELKLEEGADYVYIQDQEHHADSCALVLFQGGLDAARENVLIELLNQVATESCYNQLRTKEQLGYTVYTSIRRPYGAQGFEIDVQGERHPIYVQSRIDCYLESLYEIIQGMPEEEFLQHRNALVTCKSEKPKMLFERAYLLSGEIQSRQFKFSRAEVEIKELETVTREDLCKYFSELIGPSAAKRKRLNIHILSKTAKTAGSQASLEIETVAETMERSPVPILDIPGWKAKHEFYSNIPY